MQALHFKVESEQHDTPFGPVRMKTSSGYGIVKYKPEYEDLAECAQKHNVPFETVYRAALKDFPKGHK